MIVYKHKNMFNVEHMKTKWTWQPWLCSWTYRSFRFLSFENVEGKGPPKPALSVYLLVKQCNNYVCSTIGILLVQNFVLLDVASAKLERAKEGELTTYNRWSLVRLANSSGSSPVKLVILMPLKQKKYLWSDIIYLHAMLVAEKRGTVCHDGPFFFSIASKVHFIPLRGRV